MTTIGSGGGTIQMMDGRRYMSITDHRRGMIYKCRPLLRGMTTLSPTFATAPNGIPKRIRMKSLSICSAIARRDITSIWPPMMPWNCPTRTPWNDTFTGPVCCWNPIQSIGTIYRTTVVGVTLLGPSWGMHQTRKRKCISASPPEIMEGLPTMVLIMVNAGSRRVKKSSRCHSWIYYSDFEPRPSLTI